MKSFYTAPLESQRQSSVKRFSLRLLLVLIAILVPLNCQFDAPKSKLSGSVIQVCPATQAERLIWEQSYDNLLFKKLLNRFMDCSQKDYHMSDDEMLEVAVDFDVSATWRFKRTLSSWRRSSNRQLLAKVKLVRLAYAALGGTLGNYKQFYQGVLLRRNNGSWAFSGVVYFDDFYDFDAKKSGRRSTDNESSVTFARKYLSGKAFWVRSPRLRFRQDQSGKTEIFTRGKWWVLPAQKIKQTRVIMAVEGRQKVASIGDWLHSQQRLDGAR